MSKARARRRQSHLLRLMTQHDGRLRAQAVDRQRGAQAHRPITDDRRVMACRHDISQGQKSLEQGLISLHFWRHNDQGGVASAKRARIASAACLPSCPKPQIPPCRHALWLFLSLDRQMKSGVLLTYLLASPVQVRPNTSATMWLQTEEEADSTLGCTLLVVPVRELLFSIYSNTRATRDAPRFLRQHNRFLRSYREALGRSPVRRLKCSARWLSCANPTACAMAARDQFVVESNSLARSIRRPMTY
jgi:hypothetical protein